MMINHSIIINEEIEKVFSVFCDIHLLENWIGGFLSVEMIGEPVLEVGTQTRQKIKKNGRVLNFVQTITDYRLNELFEAKMVAKELDLLVSYSFFEENNSTKIQIKQEIILKSFLFKTAKSLIKSILDDSCKNDIIRLKSIIENGER